MKSSSKSHVIVAVVIRTLTSYIFAVQ